MSFANRVYNFGDRVLYLTQRENGERALDSPFFVGPRQYSYVLLEAVVGQMTHPYLRFGQTRADSPYTVGMGMHYTVDYNYPGQPVSMTVDFSPGVLDDAANALRQNIPGTDEESAAKRAFLGQFLLPLPVSSAQYTRMLRDLSYAAGGPAARDRVELTDLEPLIARAAELGIEVNRINTAGTGMTSRFGDGTTALLRTWDTNGLPQPLTMRSVDDLDFDEPRNPFNDEDEE